MKRILVLLVAGVLALSFGGVSQAASKYYDGYHFKMYVVSDRGGTKREKSYRGRPFVTAYSEERYSIKLVNPLPVKVAVNLIIDGLNSLTGEPVRDPAHGMKWIIPPYGTIQVRGWQHGDDYGRRFYFTSRDESYAKWQGDRLSRQLDVNCGVIAAAFFWSESSLVARNQPVAPQAAPGGPPAMLYQKRSERPFEAGTGSGESFHHDVDVVDFHYDTGMYAPNDMVVIYYDFENEPYRPEPRPVPGYKPPRRPHFAPDPHQP